ncbi:hypothetical protein [Actinomadura rubrisoli]|uniref:Uncharacterized protein n=1 Tax=Actinomadura rubrisoli TaxID=2530368 RepID=A0A4R4ZW20_9ACTN|nr:hypothetical protein [Actinomadura rubrisoli]TDD62434.1 hypothetical protein E1298_44665 [Actinomadura rubrisoli]
MSTRLTPIADGGCQQGACPTVHLTDRGTYGFQGTVITDHGLGIPDHEMIVELPPELVEQLVDRVLAQREQGDGQ